VMTTRGGAAGEGRGNSMNNQIISAALSSLAVRYNGAQRSGNGKAICAVMPQ
jgi:hypothetical protein